MAVVYIEEFPESPVGKNGQIIPAGRQPSLATQVVSITVGSLQSAAFNAKTKFIRMHADSVCSYLFGSNPTATTTTPRMAANQTEYFAVNAGDKVAVISNT